MDWVRWGIQREEVDPKGMEKGGGKFGGGSPKVGGVLKGGGPII